MDIVKTHLSPFSLLTSIFDIETNLLVFMRNKYQNFLLSINRLFMNNIYYNNHFFKLINLIYQKELFAFIISNILFFKSRLSSFKFISEDFLSIHIHKKNRLILFILLNSFEALIIKYIDIFFNFCYRLFYNSHNNNEKMKYFGKCIKNIFKHFRNVQNIIIGTKFYNLISQEKNKQIFNGFEMSFKLIGYGYIINNIYNIFGNIKDIYIIHHLPKIKKKKINKNHYYNEENIIREENDNKENICLLCLNKYSNTCCTPCGHLFCWTCIYLYLNEKNKCPICLKEIRPQEILLLQNYYI